MRMIFITAGIPEVTKELDGNNRLRHIAGTQWSTKRYMNMRPLFQADENPTEAAVA